MHNSYSYRSDEEYHVQNNNKNINIKKTVSDKDGIETTSEFASENGRPVSVSKALHDIHEINDMERKIVVHSNDPLWSSGLKKRKHSCKRRIYKKKSHKIKK
jgi:hypothetical protein